MSSVIRANEYVADTVALVLWLEKRLMGAGARAVFAAAEAGNATIHIPAMSFGNSLSLGEATH